jgi:antitoxin component HigA of HigAB toxin-antitoxin module
MSSNLPTTTPAEALAISPESLAVANAYLQNPDILAVSEELDISRELVSEILGKREVKAYVDSVFMNLGFNNRFQMRNLMDTIIKKKLEELDQADIGSNKDIIEILTLSHKMTIEHMDKEIQLEKIRSGNGKVVTNVQINNDVVQQTRYGSLLEKLMDNTIDV